MKRLLIISCVVSLVGPAQTAGAQTFRNCSALKAKYPKGIAVNFRVIGRSGAIINRELYLKNQRLDKDRDGIVCENEQLQNPPTTTIPLTCAQGGRCGVGDRGPAGGVVFYVSSTIHSWGNALEAAPLTTSWSGSTALDLLGISGAWTGPSGRDPIAKWGCAEFSIGGAKARGIGSGAANTRAIMTGCPSPDTGARIADGLVVGGADDWFLPSIDELDLLYRSREFLTDLSKRTYMSSTEADASNAVLAFFNDGGSGYGSKDGLWSVRPIRSFTASSVDTTTRTPPTRAACAQGGVCNVGDIGPGGGVVFYSRLDGGTFTVRGTNCNTQCRYLEFAPASTWVMRPWATGNYTEVRTPKGTSEYLGAGYENSVNILQQGNSWTESAAGYARTLKFGGKSDWYLPSKDEFVLLVDAKRELSTQLSALTGDFWSSSECPCTFNLFRSELDPNKVVNTRVGGFGWNRRGESKSYQSGVIAIRAF